MKRTIQNALRAFAVAASLWPALASAQSACPSIINGAVLTAAQWNACFQAKQNVLGFTPVNRAGDIMQGPLITSVPSSTAAGLNLPQGAAPSLPNNGDIWTTSSGLFVRINGVTVGPLTGPAGASFAGTSPITVSFPAGVVTYAFNFSVANTFTAAQKISLNGATLPAGLTGSVLRLGQLDGTIARLEIDSFGTTSPGVLSIVYGRGTGAAPTAVQSGDELGSFNTWGYTGAGTLSGTAVAAIRTYAAENFSSGHQGSQVCVATTAIAATTLTNALCQNNDFGITIGSPTGGSKGAGTINAAGTIYINNVAVTAAGITALTGDVVATGPGSVPATIQAGVVTYAKFQTVAAVSLIGNPTGSLATAQGVTLGATLSFSSTVLQTAAFTGDVTASANSFATTIAANAVSYAKFQQVAASSFVGNPTGSLANAQAIAIGATFGFSGTTLQSQAGTGDVTWSANSFVTTLATVNASPGSYGSSSLIPVFTVDGKGRITAITNATNAPAIANVTGLGTGVATALGVNVGTAGAFVVNGGALGSPSSAGTLPAFTLGGSISGGGNTITNLASLAIRDTSAAFDVTFAATSGTTLTAGRTITWSVGNVAHTVALGTTANTITFPNLASFTVITNGDTGTVTNTMLVNKTITVNGTTCTLGSSCTITAALTVGTSTITSAGAANCILYNLSSVLGCNVNVTTTSAGGIVLNDTGSAAPAIIGSSNVALQIVNTTGSPATIQLNNFQGGGSPSPVVNFAAAAGTAASPTTMQNNYQIGTLAFYAYDGTSYNQTAQIQARPTETQTVSAHGSRLIFSTTPAGTTTLTQTLILNANQSAVFGGSISIAGGGLITSSGAGGALGTAAFATIGTSGGTVPVLNVQNTWSDVQTYVNGDLALLGSSTGKTIFNSSNASASNFTISFPAITDTLLTLTATQTLMNKTLTSTTDVLGGVTMTLGSDATGDIYYRNSSGVLTRLAIGSSTQVLTVSGGLPIWSPSAGGSGCTASNTQVLFYSSGCIGDTGFTYAGAGQATLALGTITTNLKALSITATWNASGVTFDAPFFMNITNTASAAGSLLMDLQLGGSSIFTFDKGSNLALGPNLANTTRSFITFGSNGGGNQPGIGWEGGGTASVAIFNGGTEVARIGNSDVSFLNTFGIITWNATVGGYGDLRLSRPAAGELSVDTTTTGNSAGAVTAAAYVVGGTSPTLNTGSCSGSSPTGGLTAGTFVAATCAAGTYIISGLFAAPHGWNCDAWDRTTPADTLVQTASSTTSATLKSTTVASDVIGFKCMAY